MGNPTMLNTLAQTGPATLARLGGDLIYPPDQSNHVSHYNWTMDVIHAVCIFFFLLIMFVMIYFIVKYRRTSPHDRAQSNLGHHTGLELAWSIPPFIIVAIIFWYGFQGFLVYGSIPENAYEIRVKAVRWSWQFTHPNGAISEHLHVPAGEPVKLLMGSSDVIHSLYVPAFRVKKDVVPGRYSALWFEAKDPTPDADLQMDESKRAALQGAIDAATALPESPNRETALKAAKDALKAAEAEILDNAQSQGWQLYCTEYCGESHSAMLAKVVVHEKGWRPAEFEMPTDPLERGEVLFKLKGCAGCHPVKGPDTTCPSLEGIFGIEEDLADGTKVLVDENYLLESILNPAAKIVKGFPPNMPPQTNLAPDEIDDIILYIKSLKAE
jgi:cytochrome c oxidase subunit 2